MMMVVSDSGKEAGTADEPCAQTGVVPRAASAAGGSEGGDCAACRIRVLRFGRRPRLRAAGADTTFCPACGASLIVRDWYAILSDRIGPDGCCPDCGAVVPGHW